MPFSLNSQIKYSKILLLGLVFCVVIYSGLFGYHFFKAETKIFCKSFGEKDCSPCPEDGKCQNGLLVSLFHFGINKYMSFRIDMQCRIQKIRS